MRPLAAHPYRHVREVTPRGLKRKQSLRIDLQKSQMCFLSQKYITFIYNNFIIQTIPFLANTIDISTCLLDRLQNFFKSNVVKLQCMISISCCQCSSATYAYTCIPLCVTLVFAGKSRVVNCPNMFFLPSTLSSNSLATSVKFVLSTLSL